jgi:GPI ethanolamine phosphate transferase 1
MATLIGVDWPVNSVGVLPDTDISRPGYLAWEQDEDLKRLEAGMVNAAVSLRVRRRTNADSMYAGAVRAL